MVTTYKQFRGKSIFKLNLAHMFALKYRCVGHILGQWQSVCCVAMVMAYYSKNWKTKHSVTQWITAQVLITFSDISSCFYDFYAPADEVWRGHYALHLSVRPHVKGHSSLYIQIGFRTITSKMLDGFWIFWMCRYMTLKYRSSLNSGCGGQRSQLIICQLVSPL